MPTMSIEFRPITELTPYARNARTHSDEQIEQIAASMSEFGWTNPVLADADGIVAGHGRVLAAGLLYAQGAIVRLPDGQEIPKGCAPVLDCTGWSEKQRRAYILADNKLALNAGWDSELLKLELHALGETDFNLALTGFSGDELSGIMFPGAGKDGDGEKDTSFVISYNIIFDDDQQRDAWYDFLKRLKSAYPDLETVGARLGAYLGDHGQI